MKYATRILALVVAMLPLMASAQLESSQKLIANVPFQFRAGEQLIPAGECTVQRASMDSTSLVIGNWSAAVGLFANAAIADARETSNSYAMIFHEYGGRYFLAGIKLKGSKAVYHFHESKAEAELRAQNTPVSQEILLARLQ